MADAAALMDRMYRHQRYVYDLTRKYYLAGRDEAVARLKPGPGDTVLEIGCGTGRNLIRAARAYPEARFFGLDVSREMLGAAAASIARAGLSSRISIAQADATAFDPHALFGHAAVRSRDHFLRPVDDPALARSVGPGARRRRAGRLAACASISATARVCPARSRRRCAAGSPPSTSARATILQKRSPRSRLRVGSPARRSRGGGATPCWRSQPAALPGLDFVAPDLHFVGAG